MKSRNLILLFSFVPLIWSCQKKIVPENFVWTEGSSNEILKKIDSHEWSPEAKTTDLGGYKVQISQQSFMGIPVEDTFLKKVYTQSKLSSALLTAEARTLPSPALKIVSGLSFDLNILLKALKQKSPNFDRVEVIEEKTVLKEFSGELKAVYKVSFFDRTGEPWTLFADTRNRILEVKRNGSHFAGTVSVNADIFPMGPKLSQLSSILLENLHVQPTLSNQYVVVTSEADLKIVSIAQALKFDPKDYRFDQVQSFFYLNRALDWMRKTFKIDFARQLEVAVHVGFPEKTNSAFYFQNKVRLGSGDDVAYSKIPQDPSIITHESFHYFIDHVAGLPYQGEGGSLNEAFSDFFTAMMLSNPKLAETAYLKAPFKRTLEINRKLSEKNGGLYFDSLIVSGLLWEISKQIGTEKSIQFAFSILKSLHLYSDFADFELKLNSALQKEALEYLTKEQIDLIRQIVSDRGFHVG